MERRGGSWRAGIAVLFVSEPFACIAADCPWMFKDKLPGNGRGAVKHYNCMQLGDLCSFALPPIADDAVLFFWRVASMQREALDVVESWGFTVKSELVWQKLTRTGKHHFGMGHYVRASHEVCLICTRGKPKILSHSVRSTFAATVGRHSEKPHAFYRIAETLCAGPRLELFARTHRDGWTGMGNELAAAAE